MSVDRANTRRRAQCGAALQDTDPPEIKLFLEQQRLKHMAPRTIQSRLWLVRRFAKWFGSDRALISAKPADLRAFVASVSGGLVAHSLVNQILALRAFYASLVEADLIHRSPAEKLQSWRVPPSHRALSLERVELYLAEAVRNASSTSPRSRALALRDRACFELLFATGMRASEIVAIKLVDLELDQEAGSVLVRRAKAGVSRRLPLPPSGVSALCDYLAEGRAVLLGNKQEHGRFLVGCRGAPLERPGLREVILRVSTRAGHPTYSHAFRRTLASELVRAGTKLPAVQKVLGHVHLSTTQLYVETGLVDMRKAMNQFDRARPAHRIELKLLDDSLRWSDRQHRLFNDWLSRAA